MSKSVKLTTMLAVVGGLAIASAPATVSAQCAACGSCSACSACGACGACGACAGACSACGACAAACGACGAATASYRPVFKGIDGDKAAVSGYDVVSYFKGDGTPVLGNAKFSTEYAGATYHFSSKKNLKAFKKNPANYAPQYGGHCAWAMARGRLAPGDPKLSKVVDGKLYLNFNKNVQVNWLKDIPGFLAKSEAKWPTIPNGASVGNQ